MSGEKTLRMSEDNIPYEVLLTPSKIEYQNIDIISSQSFTDGYSFYHLYVPVSEVKRLSLPTDANPREPTRVDVVNKMISAIRDDPDKFHHWNNGITIICNDVNHNISDKTVEIDFTEGDGICNGGHTYFSIATFEGPIDDLCKVHLELVCLPQSLVGINRKHAVNQIASKRNRNRQLHPTTQADYLGLYKPFQDKLKDYKKYVSWHEGDSEAHDESIKSDHFIRLMASLDPFWFQHPQISSAKTKANHKAATGGIASIHAKWMAGAENNNPEASLFHMSELSREILELREDIAYSIKDDDFSGVSGTLRITNFYKWINGGDSARLLQLGQHEGNEGSKMPGTFEVMLIGSFRTNVWIGLDEDGKPQLIGFLKKPIDLWNETKCDILDKSKSLFMSFNNDSNTFNRADASFNEQLINIAYGKNVPEHPQYFYEIGSGEKYEYCESGATHFLLISGKVYVMLNEIVDIVPHGAYAYKKASIAESNSNIIIEEDNKVVPIN